MSSHHVLDIVNGVVFLYHMEGTYLTTPLVSSNTRHTRNQVTV